MKNKASKTSRSYTEPTWDSFLPPGCWTVSRTALEEKCLKHPAGELWFLSCIHWWAIVTPWVGEFGWGKKIISWGALQYLIELLWELNELTSAKYSEQGLRQVNAIWLLVINVTRNEWLQFNIVTITTPQIMSDMPSAMSDQYTVYIYWWIHRYIYAYNYIHSGSVVKNPPAMDPPATHESTCMRRGFSPWVGKIPWRREWQPTPLFLENAGNRGAWQVMVYGVTKESDLT